MVVGIYEHQALVLASLLDTHLPGAVAIHTILKSPLRNPEAKIIATIPPNEALPQFFLAAYVDLMRTGSQVWFYSSCQIASHISDAAVEAAKEQLCLLLQYVASLEGFNGTRIIQLASVHELFVELLDCMDSVTYSTLWLKYLYPPKCTAENSVKLGPGFQFAPVRDQDISRVIETSAIPRTRDELMILPNIAIHDTFNDIIVAWCFVAMDGSLSTLYVESEYRRRGLAKAVGMELLRQQEGWRHSDVGDMNMESRGVLKSLGGTVASWKVGWVKVDLSKLSL